CHSMVRALMGALVAVGEGRFEPSWAQRILNGGVRDPRVKVMPAHGLTMLGVEYPTEEQWAQRAQHARRRRDDESRCAVTTISAGPRRRMRTTPRSEHGSGVATWNS